jgi:SNF2 family DNA or RNA helicase
VAASQCLLDSGEVKRVIVVTPTSLQQNFKKELVAYGGFDNDKRYVFYTLTTFANKIKEIQCKKTDFLIIDEAHNLRTEVVGESGKRSRSALNCAAKSAKVLLLTATPVVNNPYDAANLAAMVRGHYPPSKKEFESIMANEDSVKRHFSNLFMFFANPKGPEYPSVSEHTIKIQMTPDYYAKYQTVEQSNNDLFEDVNPWRFLMGVRQATLALDPCQKCDWAIKKIVEEYKKGHKGVLYSAFVTYGVKKLQDMLSTHGIGFSEVTGSMNQKKRGEAVRQYNANEVSVLFITKAGGEGLDLKGTSYVILMEKGWNRAGEEQVIGRAARYMSHTHLPIDRQHVDVYHLIIVKPEDDTEGKSTVGGRMRAQDPFGDRESADQRLAELIEDKEGDNTTFLQLVKEISVKINDTPQPQDDEFNYEPIDRLYDFLQTGGIIHGELNSGNVDKDKSNKDVVSKLISVYEQKLDVKFTEEEQMSIYLQSNGYINFLELTRCIEGIIAPFATSDVDSNILLLVVCSEYLDNQYDM